MKVLIVGGGGREHAIAQSVAKSEKVDKIYCTPGNAGIAALAECAPIGAMEFDKIVAFAKEKEVDLVIVGMDDPLVGGLVDELEAAGIRAFGPKKNAAILEGSKNMCSVRHRPIPSAPSSLAFFASVGVSALVRTFSTLYLSAQPMILPNSPAMVASTVGMMPS